MNHVRLPGPQGRPESRTAALEVAHIAHPHAGYVIILKSGCFRILPPRCSARIILQWRRWHDQVSAIPRPEYGRDPALIIVTGVWQVANPVAHALGVRAPRTPPERPGPRSENAGQGTGCEYGVPRHKIQGGGGGPSRNFQIIQFSPEVPRTPPIFRYQPNRAIRHGPHIRTTYRSSEQQ